MSEKQAAQLVPLFETLQRSLGLSGLAFGSIDVVADRAGFDLSPFREYLTQGAEENANARKALQRLGGTLHAAGLLRPTVTLDEPATVHGNELAALSTIGGDDLRELLGLLERAQAVAERIDSARGFTVGDSIPLQPGESRGTDLAESVSILALRVRQEARGGVSPHE